VYKSSDIFQTVIGLSIMT